jgi:hypothetical protein
VLRYFDVYMLVFTRLRERRSCFPIDVLLPSSSFLMRAHVCGVCACMSVRVSNGEKEGGNTNHPLFCLYRKSLQCAAKCGPSRSSYLVHLCGVASHRSGAHLTEASRRVLFFDKCGFRRRCHSELFLFNITCIAYSFLLVFISLSSFIRFSISVLVRARDLFVLLFLCCCC